MSSGRNVCERKHLNVFIFLNSFNYSFHFFVKISPIPLVDVLLRTLSHQRFLLNWLHRGIGDVRHRGVAAHLQEAVVMEPESMDMATGPRFVDLDEGQV